MRRAQRSELPDDTWLTQFGENSPEGRPRDVLRSEKGETEMSLIRGWVEPAEASLMVIKRVSPIAVARHVKTCTLRSAGFVVEHDPTPNNPLHVSVHPPVEQGVYVDWDDAVASRFRQCFEADRAELGEERVR